MSTTATITDAEIRVLLRDEPDWMTSIRSDANDALSDREPFRTHARDRLAEIFDIRKTNCRGRRHDHHIGDVCEGTCCTACGGPIDENEECRC